MRFTFDTEDRKEADVRSQAVDEKLVQKQVWWIFRLWVLVSILGIIQCLEALRLKKYLTGHNRLSGEPECRCSHLVQQGSAEGFCHFPYFFSHHNDGRVGT